MDLQTVVAVAVGLNVVVVLVVLLVVAVVFLHLRDHAGPKPRGLPPVPPPIPVDTPVGLHFETPAPTTAMAIQPPARTDTSVIPTIDPNLGIDVIKLNRQPRPLRATDLINRYNRQHPPEN